MTIEMRSCDDHESFRAMCPDCRKKSTSDESDAVSKSSQATIDTFGG